MPSNYEDPIGCAVIRVTPLSCAVAQFFTAARPKYALFAE
jgi:hypothetical protein